MNMNNLNEMRDRKIVVQAHNKLLVLYNQVDHDHAQSYETEIDGGRVIYDKAAHIRGVQHPKKSNEMRDVSPTIGEDSDRTLPDDIYGQQSDLTESHYY